MSLKDKRLPRGGGFGATVVVSKACVVETWVLSAFLTVDNFELMLISRVIYSKSKGWETQRGNLPFRPVATKEVKLPRGVGVCLEIPAQNLGTGGVFYDTSNYFKEEKNCVDCST